MEGNNNYEVSNEMIIPDDVIYSLAECLYSLMKEEIKDNIGKESNYAYETTNSATEQ